ncbi:hypothetical protein UFOVP138_29 [uncultured Caudovirales phage]|uniref:Uncharacterized protein n=1 Tax=uncultured Caudovirales phage TaxID=2100421 RepID=A0A6J5LG06_9CAUD|nr:hypothetical protein UFOVP138_29 [uncultured Caudovirales phage]
MPLTHSDLVKARNAGKSLEQFVHENYQQNSNEAADRMEKRMRPYMIAFCLVSLIICVYLTV